MLLKLLAVVFLIVILTNSFAQGNSSGVFMTMEPSKNNRDFAKKILTPDNNKNKALYVPLQPIISSDEFISVSEIINDPGNNESYFNLYFSNEGIAKLKDITTKLAGVKLVLIVNDTFIGDIEAKREIVNKSIQINGPFNSPDVLWAYTSLNEIIERRK